MFKTPSPMPIWNDRISTLFNLKWLMIDHILVWTFLLHTISKCDIWSSYIRITQYIILFRQSVVNYIRWDIWTVWNKMNSVLYQLTTQKNYSWYHAQLLMRDFFFSSFYQMLLHLKLFFSIQYHGFQNYYLAIDVFRTF